jgi:G6PDH family F420-dependent oxidoreductase
MEIGYFLSSEEHGPKQLVAQAQMASDVGIGSVWISDHFHPWLDEQGQSPFVWSVIGGIAATTPLAVTTAVTCPTTRMHPAIVAQAAATSSVLLDGRFELGVGTGEYLNEHILGDRWPTADQRRAQLAEAVDVMRMLWSGEEVEHHGRYYNVELARLYTVPDRPVPVPVSAFGPKAVELAAEIGDGFISTHPDAELVQQYRAAGGKGSISGGLKICWGGDEEECRKLVHRLWRTSGVPGELSQDLRTPALFEQATSIVDVAKASERVPCGPDVDKIVEAVQQYADAGFDRLYINQIGPQQEEFFSMFARELEPVLAGIGAAPDSDASLVGSGRSG